MVTSNGNGKAFGCPTPGSVVEACQSESGAHLVTVQTSGTSESLWARRASCKAEPSAAAAGTGSATRVEPTTSLEWASTGTCGGVPPPLAGDAQRQAVDRKASLASPHTERRGHGCNAGASAQSLRGAPAPPIQWERKRSRWLRQTPRASRRGPRSHLHL